jgi:hypothetical protein
MLALRLQEPLEALDHFRGYRHFVDTNFKVNFGIRERVCVYYWYWRTLSQVLRQHIDQERVQGERADTNGDTQ